MIARDMYSAVRSIAKQFIVNTLRYANVYKDYSRRRTMNAYDMIAALKKEGQNIYGFGP